MLSFILLLLTGCGINNAVIKTEYYLGETATIDHYEIEYTDFSELDVYNNENGKFLKVNYTLTNKSAGQKTVNIYNDFKFYNYDNKLISPITNDEIVLEVGDTKSFAIVFDITDKQDMDQYKIIFYSNVVSNNIAFIIERE